MVEKKYELNGCDGQLIVYEDRITITRKGLGAMMYHGFSGEKSIPISSLTSVQYHSANFVAAGYIQFGVMGGKESRGGMMDARTDENTVSFTPKCNETAEEIKNYIEQLIFNRNKSSGTQNTISIADEIKIFKELLVSGVISQEDFEK